MVDQLKLVKPYYVRERVDNLVKINSSFRIYNFKIDNYTMDHTIDELQTISDFIRWGQSV